MKTHIRKQTGSVSRLLVVTLMLLSVLGVTRLAGLGKSQVDLATPQAKSTVTPTLDAALRQAAEYLWSRQAEDGGWHSEKYGLLRSGQALTPFILHSLLMIPEDVRPGSSDDVERALAFLRRHTNQQGVLGVADPDVLEYPNYSTAYALRCLELAGAEQDCERIRRMRAYLQAEQYTEARGIGPQSPAFGGWGFGGNQPFGETGHMDIAHTRRVLQALRESQLDDRDVYARAERFLRVVQHQPADRQSHPGASAAEADLSATGDSAASPDGGFYFSPIVLAANKGRQTDDAEGETRFRSYATSTCDGILSLLACDVSPADRRLRDAITWLAEHPKLDYPQGVPTDHPEPWGEAIHFYHLAVRGEVYVRLSWPGPWRAEIQRLVARDQRDDGSFVNEKSHLMKEDDPLLCTALAVTALNATR